MTATARINIGETEVRLLTDSAVTAKTLTVAARERDIKVEADAVGEVVVGRWRVAGHGVNRLPSRNVPTKWIIY